MRHHTVSASALAQPCLHQKPETQCLLINIILKRTPGTRIFLPEAPFIMVKAVLSRPRDQEITAQANSLYSKSSVAIGEGKPFGGETSSFSKTFP